MPQPTDHPAFVRAECGPGDIYVCLGAGDITAWARALQGQLEGWDAPPFYSNFGSLSCGARAGGAA
jgi:hypothetical protein